MLAEKVRLVQLLLYNLAVAAATAVEVGSILVTNLKIWHYLIQITKLVYN